MRGMDTLPHTFSRRILLAVTGLSPQVVTETLYALAVQRRPAFVPTEIHLITTREGAERARLSLLSEDPGWFRRFLADYGLPPIRLDAATIHVVGETDGAGLEDIRSPEDNERAADFITETVRSLTADSESALHVSIAGGRKTMGFYLGYALSLFGRTQDRLSHVLVSEPYESSWEFFYPTPYPRVIETRGERLADTAEAKVTLAEIPFVSLRHGLPKELCDGQARYTQAVQAARQNLGPADMTLDPTTRRVGAAGKTFTLPPADFALLAVFARRAIRQDPPLEAPPKGAPDSAWAKLYLAEYRALKREMDGIDHTERALAKGMDGEYFSSRLCKLHRRFSDALGQAALPYRIQDGGPRRHRYRLELPPEAVRFALIPPAETATDGASLPDRTTEKNL